MLIIRLDPSEEGVASGDIRRIVCPDCGLQRAEVRELPAWAGYTSIETMYPPLECLLILAEYSSRSGMTYYHWGAAQPSTMEVWGMRGHYRVGHVLIRRVVPAEMGQLLRDGFTEKILAYFRDFSRVFGLDRKSEYWVLGEVLAFPSDLPTRELVCGRCKVARIQADPQVRRQGGLWVSGEHRALLPFASVYPLKEEQATLFNHTFSGGQVWVRPPFAYFVAGPKGGTISSPEHTLEEILLDPGQQVACWHPWPDGGRD